MNSRRLLPQSVGDRASDRPLPLRRRPDLTIVPQKYGQHRYWLVKDPISLQYFHLRDEEHAILEMLDGQTGLAEIKTRFEKRFAPYRLPLETAHAFLGRLHECGLLLSSTPGQGEQLLQRADLGRRRRRLAAFANVLAIRFRGIDPPTLLKAVAARCGWLFSPAALILAILLMLAAAAAVVVHSPGLPAMQAELRETIHPGNLIWLAAVLAAAKILHELGHAVTCIRLGGQCRELGLMLLVFTPCLYCEVSDAWTFPSKWRRIAVSAAGIIVEIVLAAFAALVWCFSGPGLLHSLAFAVMVVCSVSTLLFNGNPLMRYDGYYVLADLLEVPNLAEQSRAVVARFAALIFLGIGLPSDRIWPTERRFLLGFYGMASLPYRCFAVGAILWIVHRVAAAYGAEVLGDAFAVLVLGGIAVPAVGRLAAFVKFQRLAHRGSWSRALVFGGFWTALLLFLAVVPWPCRVTAPLVIEPENAHRVYAVVAGTLATSVRAARGLKRVRKWRGWSIWIFAATSWS